uniref:Uncharacterized protein n=1 Tax=Arundo donax TaxID=35708 RepID=A0A0A9F574_ARUDO
MFLVPIRHVRLTMSVTLWVMQLFSGTLWIYPRIFFDYTLNLFV